MAPKSGSVIGLWTAGIGLSVTVAGLVYLSENAPQVELLIPRQQWFYPAAFLLGGLLVTALLDSLSRSNRQRTVCIEREVAERTAELVESRAELEKNLRHCEQLEHERAAQEARLRLAMGAADLGTWEWDLASQNVIWSAATERMFGLEPGSFDGRYETYLQFVPEEERSVVHDFNRFSLEGGGDFAREFRIVRRDGSSRWLMVRGNVVRDGFGRPLQMLGVTADITNQRNAAAERLDLERRLQESQKLESLGVLAGGIAHDFNNLLTGVLGNASLARMDLPADHLVQSNLRHIEDISLRAAELCKQMLAYSGKGHFIVQPLDLSRVVAESTQLLHLSISKNAVITSEFAPGLPSVSADATQIRQIIMNLVINASDALENSPGVIGIRTGVADLESAFFSDADPLSDLPAGRYVFLEVSDNGAGMSAEVRAKIFDPFFSTKFTGRGLGLAAVMGIVRGHHGALKVESTPGEGSVFTLLLPAISEPAQEVPPPPATADSWCGSGTVLVVDDEKSMRDVLALMLRSIGFEVLSAPGGHEALAYFELHRASICAVLLDLTMPGMDGHETLLRLREIDPTVRVLLVSGFNETDAMHGFSGNEIAGFLQKPFKPSALRAKLRSILVGE